MTDAIFSFKTNLPVSVSIDLLARATYIAFSTEPVVRTERRDDSYFVDYDVSDKVVGIEIIRLKKAEGGFRRVLKDTENILPADARKELHALLHT